MLRVDVHPSEVIDDMKSLIEQLTPKRLVDETSERAENRSNVADSESGQRVFEQLNSTNGVVALTAASVNLTSIGRVDLNRGRIYLNVGRAVGVCKRCRKRFVGYEQLEMHKC